jgi:SAM-dependent methyltransferase
VAPAWQDAPVTDQEARYDTIAEAYAEVWSPVHRAATLALLDVVAADVEAGATRLVDVGCGTAAMVAAAIRRWPRVELDGVDVSAGMLQVAARTVDALPEPERARIRLHQAPADRLPFDDGSVDVALTAFVLQLVPSRHRALRDMRRVLRPGGRVAIVTWMRGGEPLEADRAYDEALEDAGLEPRDTGGGSDDIGSPGEAVAILRRAGFSEATARGDRLDHQFTPESFLAFIARFDDADQFVAMDAGERAALEQDVLARLRRLSPAGLRLAIPIVYATGRRGSAGTDRAG